MLTRADGPVVCGEKTLRALLAIRREKLLPQVYAQPLVIGQHNFQSLADVLSDKPPWLNVIDDAPQQPIPPRCETATEAEAAAIRLALALPASVVLLEGPIKERVKLSYIKAEGTLSVLVAAYRVGKLSAVRPMVKALQALGHEDVLPEPAMLEALWQALDGLQDE